MISKQQFNKCVNILNAGGALITHRGYYAVQDNTHDTLINISEELFSAVIEYCGGRENFTVTDTATQFGTESTWELIIPIYNNTLPTFASTDINSKLTKTPEFKQKVDSVKQAVKNAFGCAPYERKNNAKYTLLKFWAKSIVPIGELEKIEKMFSDVSTERITSFEFNVIVYPDSNMVVEDTSDLMEALNRAHKLDEATTSVRVPAAIRDYVDAYCDAINELSSYNPDKWDRGTGVEFFDSGKHSSAYADRVMYGVMDNYELNDDQLDAVYKYVEFQEDAEWYDDSSVTNVFDASCLQDDDDDDEDEYDDDFEKLFLDEATSEKETTKTTDEIKHEITSSIWEIVHEHAYPNGCSDTDAFYSALRELSKKYSDHRRLFYNIRSRILNKEVWYD